MRKIYIAGKVTGLEPKTCSIKFETAEQQLKAKGYKVVNPLKLVNPSSTWQEAMRICLHAINDVDALFMLPCFIDSDGAKIEHQYAIDMKKEIFYDINDL